MNPPAVDFRRLRRRVTRMSAGAVVAALSMIGCGSDRPKDHVIESTNFTVTYDEGTTPCESISDELEAHRTATLDWLGLSEVPHIYYYVYENKEHLVESSPCARCTVEKNGRVEVHADSNALDEHELLHAYTVTIANPPEVLSEGLAESLECFPGAAITTPKMGLVQLLDFKPDLDHYTSAAFFVRYLIQTYGSKRFLEFYWSQDGKSANDLGAAVEEFFGVPLIAVWEAAKEVPQWQVLSCACPQQELGPAARTFSTGAEACGFLNRAHFKSHGAPLMLEGVNRSRSGLQLISCFGEGWAPGGNLYSGSLLDKPSGPVSETMIAILPAGDYAVIPENLRNKDYDLSLSPAIGWSEWCNAESPLIVELKSDQASQLSVVTQTKGYLAIQTTEVAEQRIQGLSAPPDGTLCLECTPDASCGASFAPERATIWGPIEPSDFTQWLEISPVREP